MFLKIDETLFIISGLFGEPESPFSELDAGQIVKVDANGDLAIANAEVDDATGEWFFDAAINLPGGKCLRVGNWDISNGGAALSSKERSSGEIIIAINSVQDDLVGSLQPTFVQLDGPTRLQAAIGVQLQDFVILAGQGHTYNVVNPVAGTAAFYKIFNNTINSSEGCNITIREDSASNPVPLYDLKRDTDVNGLTIISGANDIDLGTEVFFKLGANLFVTITAGDQDIALGGVDIGGQYGQIVYSENVGRKASVHQIPTEMTLISEIGKNPYLNLNTNYPSTTGTTAGIIATTARTGLSADIILGAFVEGADGLVNPSVVTAQANVFAPDDIVQIRLTRENDGVFEVESHVGNDLVLRGVGLVEITDAFAKRDFFTIIDSGAVDKVELTVLRADANGTWQQGKGATVPLTFSPISGLVKTGYEALVGDVSTTSSAFVTLLTHNITTAGASALVVHASLSGTKSAGQDVTASMRVVIDGAPVQGAGAKFSSSASTASVSVRAAVADGAHVVELQWKVAAGEANIRPTSEPDSEHCTLYVQATTV